MPNTGDWLVDYADGAPAEGADVFTAQRGGAEQITLTVDDVLAPEATERASADADLATAIADEATARATAVANEATARGNADTALGLLITAEESARIAGDDALADALADAIAGLAALYQPLSANLTELAGTNPSALGLTLLAVADAVAARLALGLVIGTDVQAFNAANLAPIAALTSTAYGRALLEVANQAALTALMGAATTSVAGIVELATAAEARTATNANVVLTALTGASLSIGISSAAMVVGRYYVPTLTNQTPAAPTVNRLYLTPLTFRRACTLDRLVTWTTGTVASSVVRLGLFTDNAGLPDALVFDAGTVSTAAGTGAKEITVNQAVDRGRYWLGFVSQGGASGATNRVAASAVAAGNIGDTSSATNDSTTTFGAYYQDSVSGGLPANVTVAGVVGPSPSVGVRASA